MGGFFTSQLATRNSQQAAPPTLKAGWWIYLLLMMLLLVTDAFAANSNENKVDKKEKEDKDIIMTLNFFEGIRENEPVKSTVVTSYSVKLLDRRDDIPLVSDSGAAEVKDRLKTIYKVKEVRLLSRSELLWVKKTHYPLFRAVLVEGHEFGISTKLIEDRGVFRIQLDQREEGKDRVSLLDTKITLPQETETVFGFEDTNGKIYFLAYKRKKDQPNVYLDPGRAETEHVPRLIYRKVPEYPEEALKKNLKGVVHLELTIDAKGRVLAATILQASDDVFKFNALKAVRHWKYEPYLVKGKKQPVTFIVTIEFSPQ
jgi:TonB family protein